jgi:hypothetical protein
MTQILTQTPLWVWGLLFGLSLLGLWAGQAREIPLTRLMLIPFIMLFFSLFSLKSLYGLEIKLLLYWFGGLGLALYMNRVLFKHPSGVIYHAKTQSYFVPQSYVPLLLMMSIFIIRYVVGVTTSMGHSLAQEQGCCSGGFMARALRIYHFRTA